ncbi:MAG TPA: tetratricopeptide repeat protein [Lacunisphaera sp.]|nr:tetratricopeptide repeat protein [Lacunisphaera sp.]
MKSPPKAGYPVPVPDPPATGGSAPEVPALAGRWSWVWLVLAVLLVYTPTLRHEFVNYDDPEYLTRNPHITHGLNWADVKWAFTGNVLGMWHPLTCLSHLLDWEMFGSWAGGHLAVNFLLHAANSVLLYLLLRRMTGAVAPSFVVALLFAIHPLNVESVAWASQRKSVLSAFFFFACLLAWHRYATKRSGRAYWLALGLFVLGLLSKSMLVTMPVVLVLLDFWPLRRVMRDARPGMRLLVEKIPFVILAAAAAYIQLHPWVNQPAASAEAGFTLGRWLRAGANTVVYLRRLVWPADLAVLYPFRPRVGAMELTVAAAVLTAISALAWRRGRPQMIGWLWFLVMLFPVSGIEPIGPHEQADRYAYLPAIGLFIFAAWLVPRAGWSRVGVRAAVLAVAGLLAATAAHQVGFWQDSLALWSRDTALYPPSLVQQMNYGFALSQVGRAAEAEQCFETVVRLNPDDPPALVNLAATKIALGRVEQARLLLEKAVLLDPTHARARASLGSLLQVLGRSEEARAQLERAVALDPDLTDARLNLGVLLAEHGELAAAKRQFEAVVALEPDNPAARENLARVLRQLTDSARK